MGARVRLLCEFTGTVVSVLPKMAATYRYDTGIRVPAGIGIPVWLLSRYEQLAGLLNEEGASTDTQNNHQYRNGWA